jgi:hypothetical protein
MSDAQPAAAPVIPPHKPVESVTIKGLRESHLSLSRLLDDVTLRLRDMIAAQYGVAVGDTVEYQDGHSWEPIVVASLSLAIERVGPKAEKPGNVVMIVRGKMADMPAAEVTIHWNPATCRVTKKAPQP